MRTTANRENGGFSLIELTIATAIFSLGMGGLSLLLLLAIQGTVESRLRTLAVIHGASLQEASALYSAALAGSFMESWQQRVEKDFPAGSGVICRDSSPDDGNSRDPACDDNGAVVIKVFWEEPGDDSTPVDRRQVRVLPLP